MADKLKGKTTPVRAYPHPSDSRANIPTAELESFARPEEKRPATVRYPRDPTLDPQLIWKGKDEQDAHDLEVPAVPIYIQETIDPLALVEELAPNLRFLNTLDLAAQRGAEPGSPCTGDGPNISGTGGKSSRFILATVRRAFAAFSPLETVVFP